MKEERKNKLINELQELRDEVRYAEVRIPEVLKEIKSLEPTEEELNHNNLRELMTIYNS